MLWFSRLGDACGKAQVQLDDGPPEVVDTFSADDIWGVCVYRKVLPSTGKHRLTIAVTGDHHPRSHDSHVYIDGLRVEAE